MPKSLRHDDLTEPTPADSVMEDIRALLRQRWTDAQRIADQIGEAMKALDNGHDPLSQTQSDTAPAPRRGMSKANREAASRRMKAYWAKKRRAAR